MALALDPWPGSGQPVCYYEKLDLTLSMGRDMIPDVAELLERNLHDSHWEQIAQRCLACDNFTAVCLTCFYSMALDTTDLRDAETAKRWRNRDSRFTDHFSYSFSENDVGSGSAFVSKGLPTYARICLCKPIYPRRQHPAHDRRALPAVAHTQAIGLTLTVAYLGFRRLRPLYHLATCGNRYHRRGPA